jgi:hypothetical protein
MATCSTSTAPANSRKMEEAAMSLRRLFEHSAQTGSMAGLRGPRGQLQA